MNTKISAGEVSLTKEIVLAQIARASTIGATDADIGSTSMIVVSRLSDTYTHTVRFQFGELAGYILENGRISLAEAKIAATSISFKVPEEFYDQIPNETSGICKLTCITYLDDTPIGNAQTAEFVARTNPVLCIPDVRGTVEDVNETTIKLTGDATKLVRYRSKAKCTILAQARNGATIQQTQINGFDVTATNVLTVDKVEDQHISFSTLDSRGYSVLLTKPLQLVEYIELTANARLVRSDPTSGKAYLEISGNFFNQSFGVAQNQLSIQYRITKSGAAFEGALIALDPELSGNTYTTKVLLEGLDYESAYVAQVTIQDSVTFLEVFPSVSRGIPVFDWGERDFRFNVPILLSTESYGAELPEQPKTGQLFFLQNDEYGYTIKVYDGSNWT
jgi:hypothetical protein